MASRSLGEEHGAEGMADAKSLSRAFCTLKKGLRHQILRQKEGKECDKTGNRGSVEARPCRASEATGGTGFTLSQMRRCALRNRLPFLHSFVMVLAAAWRTEAGAGSKLNCDAVRQVIQWSRWEGMVPGT